MAAPLVVVMGVAGSGKTTIGRAVADRLDLPFLDADALHCAAAKAQMARGEPLTEKQRGPWLDRVHAALVDHRDRGIVVACSALTIASRERIARDLTVRFVALIVSEGELVRRLVERHGHFVGPDLLASQLATLELDDEVRRVDSDQPVDEVVKAVVRETEAPKK
jgi:carbohydrate kinase (thermoresistant glucokinase family)